VATLALVPLWIAIHYVGRLHDIQHATIAAARYAAFESHVAAGRDASDRIAAITRERIFTRAPGRFGSGASNAVSGAVGALPQWRDPLRGESLIDLATGPEIAVGATNQPDGVEQAERAAFALIQPALVAGQGAFDLQRAAARRATVRTIIRPLAWPSSTLAQGGEPAAQFPALALRERLTLLVDPWASESSLQVRRRTDALSASAALRDLTAPLNPLRWAVRLFEPAIDRLCLGRLEPDLVPPDRLLGGTRYRYDLRTVACD
jgi:hypothetical protein